MLLEREPTQRSFVVSCPLFYLLLSLSNLPFDSLGYESADQVKNHPFFKDIDWVKLAKLEVVPPFKPTVTVRSTRLNFLVPICYAHKKHT